MKFKSWTILTVTSILLILAIFAGFMFIADPLLVFRKETDFFSYWHYNQLYANPGIARNYEYDTVLTGSSMMSAVDTTDVDEIFGGDSVRLNFNSATIYNCKRILDICFENNPDLKRVILSLDAFASTGPWDEPSFPLPEYLYEISAETYPSYLLSLDIFYHQIPINLIHTLRGHEKPIMDPASVDWVCGSDVVLKKYSPIDGSKVKPVNTDDYIQNAYDNLEYNLKPLFEEHPNTEFILFTPPYCVLNWDEKRYDGRFEAMMDVLEITVDGCDDYENVRIYSYMCEEEYITNLDHYYDTWHYSPELAKELLQRMSENDGRVTSESFNKEIEAFREFIRNFDYVAFYNSYKNGER